MKKLFLLLSISSFIFNSKGFSQITLISSFDPDISGGSCGIGYDADSSFVWYYPCLSDSIYKFTTDGTYVSAVARAGEDANDVDVEIAPEDLVMGSTNIAKGQLLFINGETDSTEIYAINPDNSIAATLQTSFGIHHVVGGSYNTFTNTYFLVQDDQPISEFRNIVAEIDPFTGATLQSFQITEYFAVNYGDIECEPEGNLFIVSSDEDSIALFSPVGVLLNKYDLPVGVSSTSGIALDCVKNEAWLSNSSGIVYHLGNFPCGEPPVNIFTTIDNPMYFSISPNPFFSNCNIQTFLNKACNIKLSMFNLTGEEVKIIYEGYLAAGNQQFNIDGKNLHEGVYILKLTSEHGEITKPLLYMN